jgi:hypothetical protein
MTEEESKKDVIVIKLPKFLHNGFFLKIKKNPWIISTILLGILIVILLVINFSGVTGKAITESQAGKKTVDFLNSYIVQSGGISLDSVEGDTELGIYIVNVNYNNGTLPIYLSRDGEYIDFGGGMININAYIKSISSSNTQTQEVPKSDKPEVELFVMSFCPYGTQAEKGVLPVAKLLGDKIDFKIRFVSYAMHGEKEVTENLREYCIQEIAPDKFLDYMTCFLEGDGVESNGYITNGNDPDYCLAQAGIDTGALESCMAKADEEYSVTENLNSGDTYPGFNVDLELNEEYGVQGSPTLVVNGVKIAPSDEGYYEFNDEKIPYSRSPETYKQIICSLFTQAPEECGTELSSSSPSVYFGWEGTGASSAGQC